jgi:hypothetical protein
MEETAAPVVSCEWIPLHSKIEAREGSMAAEQVRPPAVERPRQVPYASHETFAKCPWFGP